MVADSADVVVRSQRVSDDLRNGAEAGFSSGASNDRRVLWIDFGDEDRYGMLRRGPGEGLLSRGYELVRGAIEMRQDDWLGRSKMRRAPRGRPFLSYGTSHEMLAARPWRRVNIRPHGRV